MVTNTLKSSYSVDVGILVLVTTTTTPALVLYITAIDSLSRLYKMWGREVLFFSEPITYIKHLVIRY